MDEDILTRRALYKSVSFCPVEPLDYAFFFHCPSPYELPTKDCDGRNQLPGKRAQGHGKLPVVPTSGAAAARTEFRNVREPVSESKDLRLLRNPAIQCHPPMSPCSGYGRIRIKMQEKKPTASASANPWKDQFPNVYAVGKGCSGSIEAR